MSSAIANLRTSFQAIYDKYKGDKYVGYIQMSDKHIEHIHTQSELLWALDTLYVNSQKQETKVNYVLEMALFSPETKQSILVRQHNDGWLHLEKILTDEQIEEADSFYTVTKDTPKMKIAQIWEEEESEFCNNWNVLEPKALMFAGFEATPGGES